MEYYLILMLLASVGVGTLGALVGIGGGILVVPILTLVFGVPVQYAIGASMVSVMGTSCGATSTYLKDRVSNFNIGTLLNASTTVGAVVGAVLAIYLIGGGWKWAIYTVFGAVLLFAAFDMFEKYRREKSSLTEEVGVSRNRLGDRLKLGGDYFDPSVGRTIPYEAARVPAGLGVMLCNGMLSGLLGIGGGPLNGLCMNRLMKLPFKVSTTTSNFIIGVTASASAAIFFLKGYVNLMVVGPVAVGVVAGAFLGAKLAFRSKPSFLRILFVFVLVAAGVNMLGKGLLTAI